MSNTYALTITEAQARVIPYPGDDAGWFDLGQLPSNQIMLRADDGLMHLPYPRCVICLQEDGDAIAVLAKQGKGNIALSIIYMGATGHLRLSQPFAIMMTDEGLRIYRSEGTTADERSTCIGALELLRQACATGATAHTGAPDQGHTSRRRMAKGKPPLRYSWHTVTLEPSPPKRPHQGGTHASPRAHDRRGHWRKHPSGKQVWVKACRVGNAALGSVFKDYQGRMDT